ncbi:MAG: HAD family hydrolase [Rhodospirillaceae bacterium]|nr:HAD family hydrolase [Rhodospirillaceae bacterium]|tara:strand:+ start:1877 stop:2542 length:666 start_codon:yes stop_codon:yes gene_type:complete
MDRSADETAFPLCDDIGLWCEEVTEARAWSAGRAGLFLDRDGVVLQRIPYLHKASDALLVEGATDLIKACNRKEIPVILVTNQSGVGRGMYGWPEFREVQDELSSQLKKGGAWLDLVLACAYHGEGSGEYRVPQHPWRKPRPGMIHEAARILRIDVSRSWIVGDRASDIEAGRVSGLAGGVLVLSGETAQSGANGIVGDENFIVRKANSIASCHFLVGKMV